MSAAQILADLSEGGPEQLEGEPEPEQEAEEQVVFEDQTLEEIDIDILGLVFRGQQQLNSSHSAYFAKNPLVLD